MISKNNVDLVITGEGEIDTQATFGKLPVSIAKEAHKYKIPVIAVVGRIGRVLILRIKVELIVYSV